MNAPPSPPTLALIDGSGFIFRAYHSMPPLSRSDGTPVGAVYGFVAMLHKLLFGHACTHALAVFDASRISFRTALYPDYKSNRPPAPEDLVPQFPLVREAATAFGLQVVEQEGVEADDVIAAYALAAAAQGFNVQIVSSDKDMMQLVGGSITMFDAMKQKTIGVAEVVEKFGVPPAQVADVLALMGDSSDHVPGVPGIGPKTAAELIQRFGSVEALYERMAEVPPSKRKENLEQHRDKAFLSKQLVQLKSDIPLPHALDSLIYGEPNGETLIPFLQAQGFKALVGRLGANPLPVGEVGGSASKVRESSSAHGVPLTPALSHRERENAPPYTLIQDAPTLRDWIARARLAGRVAFDTETDRLDARNAELVGFSLAMTSGEACYVPLQHRTPGAQGGLFGDAPPSTDLQQIPFADAMALLKPLLEDPAVLKIGHNIGFDMHVMARRGVTMHPVEDTMVMSYALDTARHRHNMDALSEMHLGITPLSYAEVTGKGKQQIGFAEVDLETAYRYAAEDADLTLRLYHLFHARLVAERMLALYYGLERPLISIIHAMEQTGILVDHQQLLHLSERFAADMAKLEQQAYTQAGREFLLSSPKQLGEVLFDELQLPGGKKGKTGAYGTDAEILEELAEAGHALPQTLLAWRQLAKLRSTYTEALMRLTDPKDGRVHTSYHLAATSTGRFSSTDPNLQNIPIRSEEGKLIRKAFIAPPGSVLLSADYSQIELRLLAALADIPSLQDAFRRGEDIHRITASEMFGIPPEQVDDTLRRQAKTINFGIIYGISAFGLAARLGISRTKAAEFIAAYFERYPGIRDYMDRTIATCRTQGFVTTLMGRRIYVEGITDKNPNRRGFAERAAINAPLQGSAADIIKRAMLLVDRMIREEQLPARLLLQVHDELVLEVEESAASSVAERVRQGMMAAATLDIPLDVDVSWGKSWE